MVPSDGALFDGITGIRSDETRSVTKQTILLQVIYPETILTATMPAFANMFNKADRFDLEVHNLDLMAVWSTRPEIVHYRVEL